MLMYSFPQLPHLCASPPLFAFPSELPDLPSSHLFLLSITFIKQKMLSLLFRPSLFSSLPLIVNSSCLIFLWHQVSSLPFLVPYLLFVSSCSFLFVPSEHLSFSCLFISKKASNQVVQDQSAFGGWKHAVSKTFPGNNRQFQTRGTWSSENCIHTTRNDYSL